MREPVVDEACIPRLKLEGVSKRYPSRRNDAELFAIDDISFPVDDGKFVTIVGPAFAAKRQRPT